MSLVGPDRVNRKNYILFQETFQFFRLFVECCLHVQVVSVVAIFVDLKSGVFQLLGNQRKLVCLKRCQRIIWYFFLEGGSLSKEIWNNNESFDSQERNTRWARSQVVAVSHDLKAIRHPWSPSKSHAEFAIPEKKMVTDKNNSKVVPTHSIVLISISYFQNSKKSARSIIQICVFF